MHDRPKTDASPGESDGGHRGEVRHQTSAKAKTSITIAAIVSPAASVRRTRLKCPRESKRDGHESQGQHDIGACRCDHEEQSGSQGWPRFEATLRKAQDHEEQSGSEGHPAHVGEQAALRSLPHAVLPQRVQREAAPKRELRLREKHFRARVLLQKAAQSHPHFFEQFFLRARFGVFVFAAGAMTQNTAFDVIGQQFHAERIKGVAHGGDLVEDVDTITVFVDHATDPPDLAGNPVDAGFDFLGVGFVHEESLANPFGV